jgi:ribonuclease P protein component
MSIKKEKRLKSTVSIEILFKEGKPVFVYPIRAVMHWTEPRDSTPWKIGFSVSKRLYKKAVDRNRIKRIMREAFRQHKEMLDSISTEGKQLHIMLIYIGKEIHEFDQVAQSVKRLLKKIIMS